MNNQTENELKHIAAKQTLGLPLTDPEKALQTLCGKKPAIKTRPAAQEQTETRTTEADNA